jgi:hypothetical protein
VNRFLLQLLYLPITIFMTGVEAVGRMFSGTQTALSMAGPQNGGQPKTPAAPVSTGSAATISAPAGSRTLTRKENGMSINNDLGGDDIKNVTYSILFVKRDLEATLKEPTQEVVTYATDSASYGALKLMEFTNGGTFSLPTTWFENDYPHSWRDTTHDKREKLKVENIPSEDQRYIRVIYEVGERITKGDADYEKRQTKALEGIERNTREMAHSKKTK